jgi:hypothetical protein
LKKTSNNQEEGYLEKPKQPSLGQNGETRWISALRSREGRRKKDGDYLAAGWSGHCGGGCGSQSGNER